MGSEIASVIEAALVNLAFAQAELALCENRTAGVRRAYEHIKLAIADLSGLVPNFGCLEEDAA